MKLKLLDLFCCGGGAGMGYYLAGFEVTGVDIEPQPKNPHSFVLADALEYVKAHGHEYDAIHASPPCQAYTNAGKQWRGEGREYPDLIAATREALQRTGKPWVIENVVGAPLRNPVMLCGAMFPGLAVYRHRLFESNFPLEAPAHPDHVAPLRKMGRPPLDGEFMHVVGHFSGIARAKEAMGINWMKSKELAQAIPPAYTFFIGLQLRNFLMAMLWKDETGKRGNG